jgi:hypothetical protein
MKKIKLSSGDICPRCGCHSLKVYSPFLYRYYSYYYQTHFHCVAECGMDFGLSELKNKKVKIGYNEPNEIYLRKRFKFLTERSPNDKL